MVRPKTNESRAAKLEQGYAQKSFLLPPSALADLAALVKRDDSSEVDAVTLALRLARGKNAEPSNAELAAMVTRRLTGKKP